MIIQIATKVGPKELEKLCSGEKVVDESRFVKLVLYPHPSDVQDSMAILDEKLVIRAFVSLKTIKFIAKRIKEYPKTPIGEETPKVLIAAGAAYVSIECIQ